MRDANDVWHKPVKLEQKSPCTNLCVISSQTGYCIGCFLTLKEVVEWETASVGDKEVILEKVKERKEKNEI